MKKFRVTNRDLLIFFVVNFGLVIVMGIAMYYAHLLGLTESFPLVHMFYPSLGAMTALIFNKEAKDRLPKKFFATFIFFTITSIIYLLFKTFILREDATSTLNRWLLMGCLVLFISYFMDDKESIESFGLKFTYNGKRSFLYVYLFICLYLGLILLSSLILGELKEAILPFTKPRTIVSIILLPLSFIFSFSVFLGEEYGWRFFLQPALQERLGKRLGVIVLGLIWGIWHLPINFFYYSPTTPLYSLINQLIICVNYSIFFGFVYMKTKNIWVISMIHFVNNNLGFLLYGSTGADLVFTWQGLVNNLIFLSIFYSPFILTRVYRKEKHTEESNLN